MNRLSCLLKIGRRKVGRGVPELRAVNNQIFIEKIPEA